MTYAIAGVSGHTGKVVAETLLAKGKKVRVIVRDAAKADAWKARGAEVAVADLSDAAALTKALTGVSGAYLLVPPNMAAADFRAYQAATGKAILEAVRQAAVPHVVLLSSVAAHQTEGTGPIKGLYPVEKGLAQLPKTAATFVRAAYFMDNLLGSMGQLAQGIIPSFTPANLAFHMVCTQDIGVVAANALVEPAAKPGAPHIIELSAGNISMQDVANAVSKITGAPVKVAEAPLTAMAPTLVGFGFPKDLAGLYAEMTAGLVSGLVKFEGGHKTVQAPTTVEQFLRAAMPR